jgi:hypothetical protein
LVQSEYFYVTLEFGLNYQLFVNPDGEVRAAVPGKESNTDDSRRMWKLQDDYLVLQDGRQLFFSK